MKTDFEILLDFLGDSAAEVAGRLFAEPPPEAAKDLQRFATGELDSEKRHEVCSDLQKEHPTWIRYLGNRVKMKRVAKGARAGQED